MFVVSVYITGDQHALLTDRSVAGPGIVNLAESVVTQIDLGTNLAWVAGMVGGGLLA